MGGGGGGVALVDHLGLESVHLFGQLGCGRLAGLDFGGGLSANNLKGGGQALLLGLDLLHADLSQKKK